MPFREPAIGRPDAAARILVSPLPTPEASEAQGRAQFPELGLLILRHVDGLEKPPFGFVVGAQLALESEQFGSVPAVAMPAAGGHSHIAVSVHQLRGALGQSRHHSRAVARPPGPGRRQETHERLLRLDQQSLGRRAHRAHVGQSPPQSRLPRAPGPARPASALVAGAANCPRPRASNCSPSAQKAANVRSASSKDDGMSRSKC